MTDELEIREQIWGAILAERAEQDRQWGGPEQDDKNGDLDWVQFIQKQLLRLTSEPFSIDAFRKRMINVAALAVAALEAIERRETPQ